MSWFEQEMVGMVPGVWIWDYGWFEKVPRVRIRIVDGLERCPEYDMVCGKFCSNWLRTDSKE
jgi:hypothetical protein